VLHVGWQTSDAFVGDQDVLTAGQRHARQPGGSRSRMLGLNGLFDAVGEDDVEPGPGVRRGRVC
jgi:hypothetical protein